MPVPPREEVTHINNRIIYLRKTHGFSQLQLAQTLHISPSTEGMYEQGRRTPSLETLVAMSQLFGVSLDYLITGSEFDQGNAQEYQTACPCHICLKRNCR